MTGVTQKNYATGYDGMYIRKMGACGGAVG